MDGNDLNNWPAGRIAELTAKHPHVTSPKVIYLGPPPEALEEIAKVSREMGDYGQFRLPDAIESVSKIESWSNRIINALARRDG